MELSYLEFTAEAALEDAFLENVDHALVDLDGDDLVGGFKEAEGEVSGAGSDLEDPVGRVDCGFLNNGVENSRVHENVLASAFVKAYVLFPVAMELPDWL